MKRESDDGNIEYKIKLIDKNNERLEKLATQMRYRVDEGNGEAIYCIGVADCGDFEGLTEKEYNETIDNLKYIANKNNYSISFLSKKQVYNHSIVDTNNESKKNIIEEKKYVYELLVREINEDSYINIKVAVAGGVDSGKSTTMGLLTNGILDDGRGSARMSIFNYKHEIASGRTSSVAHHILGFDQDGNITNYEKFKKPTWPEIVKKSSKIISFLDLCGHEKYLKTTIRGLTSSRPDVCFIIVGANMGMNKITMEHINICISLNIPFCVIITKIDICKERKNILKDTKDNLYQYLKDTNVKKIPYKVSNMEDVVTCAKNLYSSCYVPIFFTSNVTGKGINLLKSFLNIVQKKKRNKNSNDPVEMQMDYFMKVKGVGVVIGGHLHSGQIKSGDNLYLGPVNNQYVNITVKSIHCKRVLTNKVNCGNYVCLGLKKVDINILRKGQVVVSNKKILIKEFEAEVFVLKSNHTTIKVGYQPVIHTGSIRQTVRINDIYNKVDARTRTDKIINNINEKKKTVLRTGDRAIIRFKFKYNGEYIKKGNKILMAEGKVKMIGIIRNIIE
jgi:GTPase